MYFMKSLSTPIFFIFPLVFKVFNKMPIKKNFRITIFEILLVLFVNYVSSHISISEYFVNLIKKHLENVIIDEKRGIF